jgi:hypothetical protein
LAGEIGRPAQAPVAAKTVALQERIEVAICDLQLSCGYALRQLIAGVPSVLPEACPLLVIAVLRCLGRG